MQEQHQQGLVPVLTSQAGSCLTFANWQAAGITVVSVYLADLLMKPGKALLDTLTTIREYYQWSGQIVLNASLPPANREDIYTLRSIYDGSKIAISVSELLALISRLQPDKVILPLGSGVYAKAVWQQLPDSIMPYYQLNEPIDALDRVIGRYMDIDSDTPLMADLPLHTPLYIKGNPNLMSTNVKAYLTHYLVESDKPAVDGLSGMVYSSEGVLNILDDSMRKNYQLIDDHCSCQTCQSTFTRAYLHHLLQQTPLLAQRYLIQHNVWFCQTYSIA